MKVLLYTAVSLPFLAAGLFAGQPTPVSVSPQSQTINSTVTTPYTFVASDSDGAGDLLGVDALFENVNGKYECWLFYNQVANQISVWNNDNGQNSGVWATATAGQPGPTLYGNACNIDPSTVSASASGNNLSFTVTIVLGGNQGNGVIYLSASNNAGQSSPYMQLGSWDNELGNGNPIQMSISPSNAYIANGGSTTFTVTVTSGPGVDQNEPINLSTSNISGGGTDLTASLNPTTITGSGTSTLTITSGGESPSFAGGGTVYAAYADGGGGASVNFGLGVDAGPPTLSMTLPSPNTGSSGSFDAAATDKAGSGSIAGINVLINSTLDGRNACWVWFDAQTGYIWLASDDTTTWNGVPLVGTTTTSNSQCTVGGNGSQIFNPGGYGNSLGANIVIEFNPGFAGTKTVYERSVNKPGYDTGYVAEGTYTVQ